MTERLSLRNAILAALGLALSACAVGPRYERPQLQLPEQWPAARQAEASALDVGERWWTIYQDATLNALVDEAFTHNGDVLAAMARVAQARAQLGVTSAGRYPAFGARLGADRTQLSQAMPAFGPRVQNSFRATLDASYEVDLWGRYRDATAAARADLAASEWAREAVRLSLAADVVRRYFAVIAADRQLDILNRTLTSREETMKLLSRRVEGGIASEFELRQTEAEVAATRGQLAAAKERRDREEAALIVLAGRPPRDVMTKEIGREAAMQPVQEGVPAGLPSDLLLRRPDLRQAEARLIALNARVGEARARLFPAIRLTGLIGRESAELSDLFSGPAGIFQFAAGLTQPLWNAGLLQHGAKLVEAQREEALAQYRQAVADAFGDVRAALAAQTAAQETLQAERARTAATQASTRLVNLRYEGGVASRLEVLDSERQLLQSELNRIDAERAQRVAVADLFTALGGGWSGAVDAAPRAGAINE